MDIEVHRAGRTFYPHTTVLLNVPYRQLDAFFSIPEWPAIAGARFFGIPEVGDRLLIDFAQPTLEQQIGDDSGLSNDDLDGLFGRQASGELTAEQVVEELQRLREQRRQEATESAPSGITRALERRTGVPRQVWDRAGQEMLEAVMPLESGEPQNLFDQQPSPSQTSAQRLGISRLVLVRDFPIITATYGFSRADYSPNECNINPFPPDQEYGGRLPIYVDQVQADALIVGLNPMRICRWLERNGYPPRLPAGDDPDLVQRAYFVELLDGAQLRETLKQNLAATRLVFGLIHTFCHLGIRQAALLCGLDRTSVLLQKFCNELIQAYC